MDRPVFGTVSLYEALATNLNADPVWRDLAKPITYTMVYAYLPPIDKRFYLRFVVEDLGLRSGAAALQLGSVAVDESEFV